MAKIQKATKRTGDEIRNEAQIMNPTFEVRTSQNFMTPRRAAFISTLFALLLFVGSPRAQTEQEKIEGAKKEGPVYWYGSMNVDDASALLAGLNKKYPFMDIKRYRAANAPVLSKLDVEARAR